MRQQRGPTRRVVPLVILRSATVSKSASAARGVIFALAGVLVVYAAITTEPRKAGGVDAALDTLARQPYGSYLLIAAAAGFAYFAIFALCEATWRRIS